MVKAAVGPGTVTPTLVETFGQALHGLLHQCACLVHYSVQQYRAGTPPASLCVHMQDSQSETQWLAGSQAPFLVTSTHRKVVLGPGGSSTINQGVVRWQQLHCGHVCSMQPSCEWQST